VAGRLVRKVIPAGSAAPGTLVDGGSPGRISVRPASFVHSPILKTLARISASGVALLFVVSALSFFLESLTPGDAAEQILGTNATRAQYVALDKRLGLNLPIYDQYFRWLRSAVGGNLGTSIFSGQSVAHEIAQRLPVSAALVVGGLAAAVIVGVGAGVVSAVRGRAVGRAVDVLALAGFVLPSFWIGAELILVFAIFVHWFPPTGFVYFTASPIGWLRSLALPVAALSLYGIAAIAKQTREAMLDVLGSEYVRMARANGASASSIVFRHALRNASVRIVTVIGIVAVGLLGGTVFAETVFALPGLGSLLVSSALDHDLPVVQGVTICFTLMVVLINLVVDVAYTWLDPKVRTA
jgi:peptide/nickel transport system permease protein